MDKIESEARALNIDNYAKELDSLLASQNDKQVILLCVYIRVSCDFNFF